MNCKLSIINYQLSISLLITLLFALPLKAQVTIGDQTSPQSFSVLELTTSKLKGGLRLPQLTTQQRDTLSLSVNPAEAQGLLIYNTDTGCVEFWNLNEWISICSDKTNIFFTTAGNVPVDPTATPFPQAGSTTAALVPHDTPECVAPPSPPYTESIKYGDAYTHIAAAAPAGTGAFTLKMDANADCDSRYAIIAVKDSCMNQEQYFIFVQDGTGALPAQPSGVITGPASVCPNGNTQTYSISPVAGATSYIWKLPEGWTGSSDSTKIIATPTLPAGTRIAENTAASGNITVSAVNNCGVSPALALQVTTCSGCCAYINGDAREFMCRNLGANPNADPFTPSPDLNGDYYQWGSPTPAATYDAVNGDVIVGTWNSTMPVTFWGDSTTNANVTTKSIYDPCPSGYRIPSSSELNGLANNTRTYKPSIDTWVSGISSWTGVMCGNLLFLPAAGYIDNLGRGVSLRGTYGLYPSNSIYGTTLNYANGLVFSSSGGMNASSGSRAFGESIRCIKQ